MTRRTKARIPQAGDSLLGPISFGLRKPISTNQVHRKPPKGFVHSDRRLDIERLTTVLLKARRKEIKAVLDSMPWSQIEQSIRSLPKEIRRNLRRLAENGRI